MHKNRFYAALIAALTMIALVLVPGTANAGRTVTKAAPQAGPSIIVGHFAAAPAGYRTLVIAYEHANFVGQAYEVYVRDQGDCDAGGYTKEIISNDWKGRISSLKITPGSYCSMVNVWRKTQWNTNSGYICASGQLPMYNLGAYTNCNDNVWGLTVYKGPRRG